MDYKSRRLILPTLASLEGHGGEIADHTFDDCDILGPAVLFLRSGVTMTHCNVGPRNVWWSAHPEHRHPIGLIGLTDCTFTRCRFKGVGFLLTPDEVARRQEHTDLIEP